MKSISLFLLMVGCAEKSSDSGQEIPEETPVEQPSTQPANEPTSEPESSEPTSEPSTQPANEPTSEPESSPTTCTLSDLDWSVEMRGSNGVSTSFSTTENVVLAGVVRNPCTNDFILTTNNSCLISQASVQGNSGNPNGDFFHSPFCASAITDWIIVGGGMIEEAVPVGVLPEDTYTVEIMFADSGAHSASGTFDVVP